jgi:transposase
MYEAEGRAREQGLQGDAVRQRRQARIRPIAEQFRRWLAATKPTLVPTDPLAAAIRYDENHWDALLRFVDNPLIPIDNSASERELQNVAKLRLNMLFAGGTEGAHRAATLLGVVATCRAIGLNAQTYLTWVFDRVGTHRDLYALPLERLTPACKTALAA